MTLMSFLQTFETFAPSRNSTYSGVVLSAALKEHSDVKTKQGLNTEKDRDSDLRSRRTKPTCHADPNTGQNGGDGSRLNQPDQDHAERAQSQTGTEKPVDQGPELARRGHDGARVPPCLGIVRLKAVLLTQ